MNLLFGETIERTLVVIASFFWAAEMKWDKYRCMSLSKILCRVNRTEGFTSQLIVKSTKKVGVTSGQIFGALRLEPCEQSVIWPVVTLQKLWYNFIFLWFYLKISLQQNKMCRKQNSLTVFRSQSRSLFFNCECGPAPCPESKRKLPWLSFVCTVCLSVGTMSHSSSRARGSMDSRIDNNTLEGWTHTITLRSKVGYSKWLGFLVLILFQCFLIWSMEGWVCSLLPGC